MGKEANTTAVDTHVRTMAAGRHSELVECGAKWSPAQLIYKLHSTYNSLDSQVFRRILDGGGSKFGLKKSKI